jgi:16S rRNA (adenine1518-N6/adenine1519-N6)-dimethyltransferase
MSVYEETQAILNTYKIQANKSLGQNFLIDDCVIEKIIESSNIEKEDLIIEIGPGLGVLTERLLKKSNNVVVIELDKKMIEILQNRFCLNRNLEIINNDVLKVDLEKLIKNKKEQTNIIK